MVRLYPDFMPIEEEYYKRTRIYPIMHTVVIKREIYDRDPWVALSLYKALCRAKEISYHLREFPGIQLDHFGHLGGVRVRIALVFGDKL